MNARTPRHRGTCAALAFAVAAATGAQELHLFPPASLANVPAAATADAPAPPLDSLGELEPWDRAGDGLTLGAGSLGGGPESPAGTISKPDRRCVLFQCADLPIQPAQKLFNTGSTLWTAAGVFVGIIDGMEGPITYGVHGFRFTDEGFFQYSTYGGGSDKASHCVISANTSGLLYDAYRLNGLTEDQSFALSFATTVVAGVLVEVGDGLTPYGFSAQDLTADTVGALAGALVKRGHLDDLIGFQFGKIPTTIPPAIIGDRPLFGIDYSHEIYSVDMKLGGLAPRLSATPGPERFFQLSFIFLTKGFGYEPPLESRYQEVGLELGLNFPEILRAAGVNNSTWWGDTLLRMFQFFRIPFTQIGTYYNFKSQKWYGPGAAYHYY